MKYLILILFVIVSIQVNAQIETILLKKEDLSESMKYKGNFLSAIKWNDDNGENVLILSHTKSYMTPGTEDPDSQDKEIYGASYIVSDGESQLLWKLLDFVRECPFDLYAEFLEVPPAVTDLDKDGVAETWIVYKRTCTSDVSPMTMKIIMHEGTDKYAIRGSNKVKINATEYIGGENKPDKAFENGPKEFLEYALKLWEKNVINKW